MWIFHPLGFCSVVADAERPGHLLCRGRVRGDLERLFPDYKIITTPGRDYRFRVSLPRAVVAARVAEAVEAISYGNFKDACPKDRHGPYLRVWTVMHELQRDRGPRGKRKLTVRPVFGELRDGMMITDNTGRLSGYRIKRLPP